MVKKLIITISYNNTMPSMKCKSPKYRREYIKLRRHLDYYLDEALSLEHSDPNLIFSELEIIEMLYEKTGIRIMPETLRNGLKDLEEEGPFEPVYRLRKGWFDRHPPKAPRNYRKKTPF
jgi:hypothetical protein